jgi:hypothetical protein
LIFCGASDYQSRKYHPAKNITGGNPWEFGYAMGASRPLALFAVTFGRSRPPYHTSCRVSGGSIQALQFIIQFVDAPPPRFIFPTFHVRCTAEAFLFYRVDLLLNQLSEFVSDTYQIAVHGARSKETKGRGVRWRAQSLSLAVASSHANNSISTWAASRNTQVSPNAGVRGKSNKETALHADRFANLWFFIIIPAHRLT